MLNYYHNYINLKARLKLIFIHLFNVFSTAISYLANSPTNYTHLNKFCQSFFSKQKTENPISSHFCYFQYSNNFYDRNRWFYNSLSGLTFYLFRKHKQKPLFVCKIHLFGWLNLWKVDTATVFTFKQFSFLSCLSDLLTLFVACFNPL